MTIASNALNLPIAETNADREEGLALRSWPLLRGICKSDLLQRMPVGLYPCAIAE
jgi:hypothetical protein